jgi:hypothetical protein
MLGARPCRSQPTLLGMLHASPYTSRSQKRPCGSASSRLLAPPLYRLRVHFMHILAIGTPEELGPSNHKAVFTWECYMARSNGRRSIATKGRPRLSRRRKRASSSTCQARARSPVCPIARSHRSAHRLDCAVPRSPRSKVGGLHQSRGYGSSYVMRKGSRCDTAINPQTAARLRAYLDAAGHGANSEAALSRPLRHGGEPQCMDPPGGRCMVRKYFPLRHGAAARRNRCKSPLIVTPLESTAHLRRSVHKHPCAPDPSTLRIYDRRVHKPGRTAVFSGNPSAMLYQEQTGHGVLPTRIY